MEKQNQLRKEIKEQMGQTGSKLIPLTKTEPMEQSPVIIDGEAAPITHYNGLYQVKGIEGQFSNRFFAERAYKNLLVTQHLPKLNQAIKDTKRKMKVGLAKESDVVKAEENKREWLDKH